MLSLILALAVGQTAAPRSPVAVVVSSKRPGANEVSLKVATRVRSAIANLGVDDPLEPADAAKKLKTLGYSDPRNCQAGTACLTKLATLLGPKAIVVGVDAAKVARTLVIHLEAVGAEGGPPLATADLNGSFDSWLTELSTPIDQFAKQVADAVTPPAPKVATNDLKPAPVEPAPQPGLDATVPPPPPPAVTDDTPHEKSRVLPFTLGAIGIVSLAASGTFLGLGLADKSSYDNSAVKGMMGTTTLGFTEAHNLANSGNLKFDVALATAILGGALITLALIFLLN